MEPEAATIGAAPPTKKPKKAPRATCSMGAPLFVIDGKLDPKGLDAFIKKLSQDKAIGDVWKAKAVNVQPKNVGKEMIASISDDKLQKLIDGLVEARVHCADTSTVDGINASVLAAYMFLQRYYENLNGCSRYVTKPKLKDPNGQPKKKGTAV